MGGGDDRYLQQATFTKIVLNNDIIHCCHDKPDLLCIGGTGEMSIDLFRVGLVEGNKSIQDIIARCFVCFWARKIREVFSKWMFWQLLLEDIDLVEEKNDGCLYEPS